VITDGQGRGHDVQRDHPEHAHRDAGQEDRERQERGRGKRAPGIGNPASAGTGVADERDCANAEADRGEGPEGQNHGHERASRFDVEAPPPRQDEEADHAHTQSDEEPAAVLEEEGAFEDRRQRAPQGLRPSRQAFGGLDTE
jgi:hypothetical protein